MPPTYNKLNPFSFTKEELKNLLKENINFNESIFSKIITGVGKNLSNDLFIEYKNIKLEKIKNIKKRFIFFYNRECKDELYKFNRKR